MSVGAAAQARPDRRERQRRAAMAYTHQATGRALQKPSRGSARSRFTTRSRTSDRTTVLAAVRSQQRHGAMPDVAIAGGGLAGLACAYTLERAGVAVKLYEASDGVGGRCRTDLHPEGFLLDRGFQIMLSAYPECRRFLRLSSLNLSPFYNGALVWCGSELGMQRVADPFRHPLDGLRSLLNPVGSPIDKVLVAVARARSLLVAGREFQQPETSIAERLRNQGFSQSMTQRFFKPFLGGIFFDSQLQVSSRLFDFVMRMLALGSNTLPAAGIGSVPEELASFLSGGTIVLNSPAHAAAPYELRLEHEEESVQPRLGVVIATEQPAASQLLQNASLSCSRDFSMENSDESSFDSFCLGSKADGQVAQSTTLYFASDNPPPINENVLLLNGTSSGVINNACFPANIAKTYAPPGSTLVSATVIGLPQELTQHRLQQQQQVQQKMGTKFAAMASSATPVGASSGRAAPATSLSIDTGDIQEEEEEEYDEEDMRERAAEEMLVQMVREDFEQWFGKEEVDRWRFLRMYTIPFSHPPQQPPTQLLDTRIASGLYVCGDHRETATFDGAIRSGRRAAESLLRDNGLPVPPLPERME